MKKEKQSDVSFLNGVPELLVLRLLEPAGKEMYGYEVVRAIGERTGEALAFGEGCIYPILHAMEKKKWLTTRRKVHDGRQRIYYRLTELGRGRLTAANARWAEVSAAIGMVMGGGADAKRA